MLAHSTAVFNIKIEKSEDAVDVCIEMLSTSNMHKGETEPGNLLSISLHSTLNHHPGLL